MKNNTSIRQIANLIISKILLIIGSIWSFIPIILGILIPMTIIIPLAYTSWFISSLLPEGLSLSFEAYIQISIENFSIQNIFLLILEGIIFAGGLLIFILGFYHLMKGKKQKVSIISTGIYQSIRHPQNLGICLIALPFTLYIPGFSDLGIRLGEIFSWLLFVFFLTIYSNIEEYYLVKRFPEEYSIYQIQTGFFLPKLHFRVKIRNKKSTFISTQKRFAFLTLGYFISAIILFFFIYILVELDLIKLIIFF